MKKPLTDSLVTNYRIDERSKTILRGILKCFPGSSIEWISAEEADRRRKESHAPAYANALPAQTITTLKPKTKHKNASRGTLTTSPRLFEKEETSNVEYNSSTN
jgi:hypothetical protein